MQQMIQLYFMSFFSYLQKLMQQQLNTNNIKQQIFTVDELLKKVAKSRQRNNKKSKEKIKKATNKVSDKHQGAIKSMEIIQQQNMENSEQFSQINNDSALNLGRLNPNQTENVQNNEENNAEQHLEEYMQNLFKGKVASKWKRQAGQKKGRFSPEQQRIINKAVGQFLVLHQIKYDDFISQIADRNFNKSVLADLDFYNKVSSLLPNRSTYSCYKYLRRNYQKQNKKGKWSVQQQTKLLSLVESYGKKWNQIAKKMGRYPTDVSLKYQTLGCQNAKKRVKGRWTFSQLVNLLKLVQKSAKIEFLDKVIQNELANETQHNMKDHNDFQMRSNNSSSFQHHNNRIVLKYMRPNTRQIPLDMISWSAISKKIKTRSMIDCRNKFFQLFESTLKGYKVKNEGIINFIDSQNIIQECQIDWELWQGQDMTFQQAKNRFLFLKKLIKSKAHTPFVDQIAQLKKIIKNSSKY